MALALYDPNVGYYRKERQRIGYGGNTDFYTATTSGTLLGELVVAACATLLGDADPAEYTFVEAGAETNEGVLKGVTHPFRSARTCRIGEPLEISGRCVVFSNELFDAQPFRRFVGRNDNWREIGVRLQGDTLSEVELPTIAPDYLPCPSSEGYTIDAPHAAAILAERIAAQPWTGLFVACDYGKSWDEIEHACPAGTARSYFRHTQSNDLLARPGNQDLTCHICWDWMKAALTRHSFVSSKVESQESFFVRHAGPFIAALTAAEAARYSQRKAALLQLLHPAHLGQKFQVLHAMRSTLPPNH